MTVTINGTTGIAGVDGSASTPASQGTDTNTGIFYPAADTVGVSTGGTERMRIASTGNVGIGGTPSADTTYKWLNIVGPTTSGGGIVQINTSDSAVGANFFCNNLAGYLGTSTAHPLLFRINSSEAARIDTSGNFLVGVTADPAGAGNYGVSFYKVANGYEFHSRGNGTGTNYVAVFYNGNGTVGNINTSGSTTSYVTTSDYRLKENVQPMQNALDSISALKPVTYTWKVDGSSGQGFIAHELQEIVPDCVTGEKDAADDEGNPIYQGIDTSFLVATLTAAIQEQQTQIEELKAKIAALESK